jgi:hypothetical protein
VRKTTQPKTELHTHTKLKLEHIEQKLGGRKKNKRRIQQKRQGDALLNF